MYATGFKLSSFLFYFFVYLPFNEKNAITYKSESNRY